MLISVSRSSFGDHETIGEEFEKHIAAKTGVID
jgi:hypothetical protein